ncbi:RcnB family protein [Polaromonas hydrogenivorans]|uniref:RcnB family protein n=1 Tax=Polaromonas hydrogenivorans TaxID=335476 RepID=A0AAU7LVJ5_9BURK
MKSKAIICAIAAASFSFTSLSFADNDDRRGSDRESSRAEQRGPMGRDGHDSGPRGFDQRDHRDQRDNRNGPNYGNRGFDRQDARGDRNYGARGPQFHRGGRIPQEYRNRQYVVNNWRDHHLNAPPRGQQWVQVGADYALIAIATGVIAQLILSQ